MANVLGQLFGDIAGAIRDMTGESPDVKMKPAEFPQKIRGINAGSGDNEVWADASESSGLVGNGIIRYVTFMNYDGTVEYGRKSVIKGENCVDPVTGGFLDTPTRESSVIYNYTFMGWATEPNGGVNADALKAVTEDRTVYANFASSIRYYTITFYDSDGATVLTTKSVAYGAIPEYVPPSKTGYTFVGWDKPLVAVTGATSYIAQWTESAAIVAVATFTSVPSFNKMVTIDENGVKRVYTSATTSSASNSFKHYYSYNGSTGNNTQTLSTSLYQFGMDITYDGGTVSLAGPSSTGSVYYLAHKTGGNTKYDTLSGSGGRDYTAFAYSPISSMYAYSSYNQSKNWVYISTGGSFSVSDATKDIAIGKNDEYIIRCGATSVEIYKISNLSKVATLSSNRSVNSISVSADGLKVVVGYSASPYVSVYSLETLTEICSLNTYITASSRAAFVGDLVVVATGSKIRAFNVADSTPTEYLGIPAYSGGSISKMAVSHDCKVLALYDGTDITMWAKA